MNPRAHRLSRNVRPTRYDVHVDARPGRGAFHGRVAIALTLDEPTREIELHARDLELTDAAAVLDGRRLRAAVEAHAERETVTLRFGEDLPAGAVGVEVAFSGHVSPSMEGLYLARDGHEAALATQFQETDARGVFPCFDEPDFKASVAWTVTTDADLTVLTNGLHESVRDEADGARTWTFAPTPPIPTYIAALVIGDFAATDERVVNDVPMRVWALRGKERLGEFSNEFAARLLPWFEEYFATPYPYGKYDQVGVPGFSAGAMENAGLVTFRQAYLLMDARTASWRQEKQIARVVAHEFAHMWFGDLVTMRWWDDIWLNEAFAEWMAHKAVDALTPEYRVWDVQQTEKTHALAQDALASTHAIYHPVETPEQATELFDAITYYKGAATMRMLEHYLGEERFREGLRAYMAEFAFANAAGADLWRHLEAASGEPVGEIMGAWIREPGHPVVRVRVDGARTRPVLHLEQRRFYSAPDAGSAESPAWPVPLVVRYRDANGVHETRVLMRERAAEVPLDTSGGLRWVVANAEAVGVYRVDADDAILESVLANLDDLTPAELTALLDDEWGLVRNATRPMSRYLRVLARVAAIDDYHVVERVADHLRILEDLVLDSKDDAALARFRGWVRATLKPQLDAVGIEPRDGESRTAAQRRVALLEAVAGIGRDEETIAACERVAAREAEDPAAVEPNLAAAAVAVAARFGDAERFERFVDAYGSRKAAGASPAETDRYLYGLPLFEAPGLADRVFVLMDEKVVPQEAVGPLMRLMLAKRHSQEAAWARLKSDWHAVRTTLGDMWTGQLVDASGHLPPAKRADLVAFYDENLKGVAQQAYGRALERMDQRAELSRRTREDLLAWCQGLEKGD